MESDDTTEVPKMTPCDKKIRRRKGAAVVAAKSDARPATNLFGNSELQQLEQRLTLVVETKLAEHADACLQAFKNLEARSLSLEEWITRFHDDVQEHEKQLNEEAN